MKHFLAFVYPILLLCTASYQSEVSQAISRAQQYILDERNSSNLSWHPKEAAAAFMGVISASPAWMKNKNIADEIAAMTNGLQLAFAKLLTKYGSVTNLDNTVLPQMAGALQTACLDPSKFLDGHVDLIAEVEDRAEREPGSSMSLGGMILVLCTARKSVSSQVLEKLKYDEDRYAKAEYKHFAVERSSINIMAAECIIKAKPRGYKSQLGVLHNVVETNAAFLNEQLAIQPNKVFESLYSNALTAQVKSITEYREKIKPNYIHVDRKKIVDHLLTLQKADGSFGGSIMFTAMVLPALSSFTAIDIGDLECDAPPTNKVDERRKARGFVKLFYEIREDAFSKQSLFGGIEAKADTDFLSALEEFSEANPEVFEYESKEVGSFPKKIIIASVNGIKNDPRKRLFWRVYKDKISAGHLVAESLDEIKYANGDTFILRYEKIL